MVKFILTKKDKKIREKTNIRGKIKDVIYFSTEDNKKYAIVINKVSGLYAIRLINYEGSEDSEDGEDSEDSKDSENEIKVKAIKRFPNLTNFYRTKEEAIKAASEIKETPELINQCVYEIEIYEDDVEKNIFLVGRKGSGKSALANVISGSDKFFESPGSTSDPKNFHVEVFEYEGIKYRVVENIAIDTNLSFDKSIYKLAEAIYTMKRGIDQVLVVLPGRFTEENGELLVIAKKIFGKKILEHTTIVRNWFMDFEISEKCDEEKKRLKEENKKFSNLIERCKGIICVDNPPLDSQYYELLKKIRESSRKKLLEHLKSHQENYRINNWDDICVAINDYVNAKNLKEIENARIQSFISGAKTIREINLLKNEINDVMKKQSIISEDSEANFSSKRNICSIL
ncbi:hypothetical protein Glove_117g384 [Diversispora epigaea]|uniref:AIG1-type G domain-containing protein n=1 Tax=Diversispora epigaea TaxID=1348612 RepID=A0A397IZZ3_9GLOM|nr:hypothetical protein Glove_117g384 [Diversispora epigaea]